MGSGGEGGGGKGSMVRELGANEKEGTSIPGVIWIAIMVVLDLVLSEQTQHDR